MTHVATTTDFDWVAVVGGAGDDGAATSETSVYDPDEGRWKAGGIKRLHTPRAFFAAANIPKGWIKC